MNVKELLCQLYETSLKEIESIRNLSIEYNMINDNSFLNWLDSLNEFSIDPNQ